MLLRDPNIPISSEVLAGVLGDAFGAYQTLEKDLIERLGLIYQWNFYKDGKAWLCKVSFKKKTVFWLSVWEGYFKITFYFSEKTLTGILDLPVNRQIVELLNNGVHIGKFIPLTLDIHNQKMFSDLNEIIKYKMSLK